MTKVKKKMQLWFGEYYFGLLLLGIIIYFIINNT